MASEPIASSGSSKVELSAEAIQQLRQNPVHTVLFDLGQAARQFNVHQTDEFKKLVAYVMETADGRDRREPWVQRPGVVRPVPKLRLAIDACFDMYGDLQWFKLNKTTNKSGQPLLGLFPRMAATIARVDPTDFGMIVEALVASDPDRSIAKFLEDRGGRIPNVGIGIFSQLAVAFRRDLYFHVPREWGETSGVSKFIGTDLRRYLSVCRALRRVCDALTVPRDIRGSVFERLITTEPVPAVLQRTLSRALGERLARFATLDPGQALEPETDAHRFAAQPLEFAAATIRARRGDRRLRESLCRTYGLGCAITGPCPKDLLEAAAQLVWQVLEGDFVDQRRLAQPGELGGQAAEQDLLEAAYIVPFPSTSLHSAENAILLRSDLHTLWDLNLIAIEPDEMIVRVAERLEGSHYEKLSGRTLLPSAAAFTAVRPALAERWRAFQASLEEQARAARPAPPPKPAPEVTTPARAAERRGLRLLSRDRGSGASTS